MLGSIIALLANQGTCQTDDFAGVTSPKQWSPVALAAVLACPKQAAQAWTAPVRNLLYLDDRALLAEDEPSLHAAVRAWSEFGTVSRMRTHSGKTQFFFEGCRAAMTLLRCWVRPLGSSDRQPSAKKLKRRARSEVVAARISFLPVSLRFRATLAPRVYSPRAAWTCFFSGRKPSPQEFSGYFDA